MVEGLFSLLFYCESGINQYAGQITLGANALSYPLYESALAPKVSSVGLETLYCHSI